MEHRALAGLAGHSNLASHKLDILLADGQTQSGASSRRHLLAQLDERKENTLTILSANTRPRILNLKSDLCSFGHVTAGEPGTEPHPARVGVFDGVAHQVEQ